MNAFTAVAVMKGMRPSHESLVTIISGKCMGDRMPNKITNGNIDSDVSADVLSGWNKTCNEKVSGIGNYDGQTN